MANFESGVSSYVNAYTVIQVHFPVDDRGHADICCRQCPYLSSNDRLCQLNKEVVAYPAKKVGNCCPLMRQEGE